MRLNNMAGQITNDICPRGFLSNGVNGSGVTFPGVIVHGSKYPVLRGRFVVTVDEGYHLVVDLGHESQWLYSISQTDKAISLLKHVNITGGRFLKVNFKTSQAF